MFVKRIANSPVFKFGVGLSTIGAGFVAIILFIGGSNERNFTNTAAAQNTQSGSGNIQIGGDSSGNISNRNINIDTLNIITHQNLEKLVNGAQRAEAEDIAEVIERLVLSGQLSLTNAGAESLMEEIIALAKKTPLKRDNIASQQFELPADRAKFLYGGRNRITFRHWSWRGHATLRFNGKEMKINFGESIPFQHNGNNCELVLNGINERKRTAEFTSFC